MALKLGVNTETGAQIIRYARLLYERGLIAGADGNLSVRLNVDRYMVTASGIHKGLMGPEGLVVTDTEGQQVEGTGRVSSEVPMHLEIYSKVRQARAVIHAHAPWSTAASLKRDSLDLGMLAEGKIRFPRVEVVPMLPPGSMELAIAAGEAALRQRVFILKGHGVVAWGSDLHDAFCLAEALEHNVRILALSSFW